MAVERDEVNTFSLNDQIKKTNQQQIYYPFKAGHQVQLFADICMGASLNLTVLSLAQG